MEKDLKQFLIELRSASKKCLNIKDAESLINKYEAIFSGKKFNTVLSTDIRHALQKTHGIKISIDEFHSMLPAICSELDIQLIPMTPAGSTEDLTIHSYWVIL